MNKVIVDENVKAKLNGLSDEMELCDTSGRQLGRFLPTDKYDELLSVWAAAFFTEEDLKHAATADSGRPLAEIWKSLGQA